MLAIRKCQCPKAYLRQWLFGKPIPTLKIQDCHLSKRSSTSADHFKMTSENDATLNEGDHVVDDADPNNMAALEDVSLETEAIRLESCEDETFNAKAFKWCKRCLSGAWANCPFEKFKVNYISGGLTNYLYLCSIPDDIKVVGKEPRKVCVRIYGEIIDNKTKFYEGVIFTLLAERGFGPHLYGVFSSGRIEEYIPSRHLHTRELADPHLSTCIAKKMGEYHCMDLPLNKEPTWMWEMMDKYLEVSLSSEFTEEKDIEMFKSYLALDIENEYRNLRTFLESINSEVVFCHNDMQEGNILLVGGTKEKRDVLVIDYEYSSYNYRKEKRVIDAIRIVKQSYLQGFDVGNHFCEWMYNYSTKEWPGYLYDEHAYPTKEQQLHFIRDYVKSANHFKHKGHENGIDVVDEDLVERIRAEGNRFALASHLFWGMWSIVQAQVSKIEFGFMEYAMARFGSYFKQKKEFWPE